MPIPPKVSICIPTYNRAALFEDTLRSVLGQSYSDFEVCVSDNASEEDIGSIISQVDDHRIKFYQQKENRGATANLKFLESICSGEYVLFLCSDDLLLPKCLERAVKALDLNPTRGGVFYRAAHYSAQGYEFESTLPALDYADSESYRTKKKVRHFPFSSPSLCLFRRSTFDRLGGWDSELKAVCDYEMYSRVVRNGGGIAYLHEVLAIMRLHGDRESNNSALTWDFYHDVLIMANRPEFSWGAAYKANVVASQLLWDLRLRRDPRRTIRHALTHGAWLAFCVFLPYEILRRSWLKIWMAGQRLLKQTRSQKPSDEGDLCTDRVSLDGFWYGITSDVGDENATSGS
jgi:glycosyltransferase involved in cell wall biosynthesis